MTHEMIVKCALRTPNLRLEPRMCVSNQRDNVTCEVCCSHPVGCSSLLSAVNDLTATFFFLQSVTSEQLSEEAAQRVAPFYDAALSQLRGA